MNQFQPPHDEFDAARIVVEVLKALPADEQARAIRWAQEKLGVIGSMSSPTDKESEVGSVPVLDSTSKRTHELTLALSDPTFLELRANVDKMLYVLGAAHALKPGLFEKVLLIQGRERRYFAKNSAEIERSGNSTQPRKIPNTEYWVMTNSPTPQKQDLLGRALRKLGFSENAVRDAVAAIV
jgi:negative modulator of initiation of replication